MRWALVFAVGLLGLVSGQTFIDECQPCRLEACPPLREPCLSGVVKDSCNCCDQCGRLEGEKCDNTSLPLPSRHEYGLCGENLICALRKDLQAGDAEALCTCVEPGVVCGNDGVTYDTVCSLRQVAAKTNNENLFMQDWGPCRSAPVIVSGPESVTDHVKESVALSCEAKGVPVPVITWEVETNAGKKLTLPSDDPIMAVQVRGGPEPYMVTSWVQIMELRPTDSGTYTCVAKNSEGEVRAAATLGVNKVKSATPGKPKSNKNKKPPTATTNNQSPKTAQADQHSKKQAKDVENSASATKDPKGKAKKAKSHTVA